jgi:hypothetical protein
MISVGNYNLKHGSDFRGQTWREAFGRLSGSSQSLQAMVMMRAERPASSVPQAPALYAKQSPKDAIYRALVP